MDSGLGSDDEKKSRTKAQKQLQNEQKQLFSGCFIDATSLSDEGEFELRRSDERRQGALIFRSSIPQYSMLQMPSLDSGPTSEDLNGDLHEEKVDETQTATPHNSIVQLDSELVRKTPVGFYVDLGNVEVVENPPAAPPVEKKNIFSMTIDFNVPKREMPSRLSTSLYNRKKSGLRTPLSLSTSRLSDRPSSSSSNNDDCPLSADAAVEVCVNSKCMGREEVAIEEEIPREIPKPDSEKIVQKETVDNNKEPADNMSRPAQQYVKLSDLEEQSPRMDLFFSPRMSRSIPEKSWVESPLATFRSASYRSSPQPFHLECSEPVETNPLSDSSTLPPKRSVQRLGTDLLRMFLEEIGPDVTVEVNGRRLRAHKCILSSRCQYFAAVLGGKPSEDVVSIQGYSYAAVHFAMCHIYSGAAHIPQSISVIELASLADMLGLEGLKEVVTHALKVRHCHNFHKPCTGCISGVFEVLPLSVTYGLDDLYQASLKWISQYFIEVWPTRAFANLPRELRDKCYQQHVIYMAPETVLETIINCDTLLAAMPTAKWAEHVAQLTLQLADHCQIYLRQHFSAVLNCPSFLALNDQLNTLAQLEETLLSAAELLKLDQACHTYLNCHRQLKKTWSQYFQSFVHKICTQVENCIVRQIDQASRSSVWMQLEPALRRRIRDLSAANLRRMKISSATQQSKVRLDLSSSSDSSRNSSPAIKNTNRTQVQSPSLRRSLLIAARTPYMPPSPSTYRRTSTLTNPTQSSAAKSTSRNVPTQKPVAPKPIQTKDPPKRPSTASTVTQKTQPKREVLRKTPAPSVIPKRTVKPAVQSSPKRTGSAEQKKKSTNVDTAHKKSPTVQRSGTFLKEEPTILHKLN
uniref:BTB domain-containing protein n=1 Tax=Photinus pyralis TaxID=7054 RepID=A0A1Y1M7L0_PHOPY